MISYYCTFTAAVARKIYLRQGTGVGALRKRFGGNYRYVKCSVVVHTFSTILYYMTYFSPDFYLCSRGACPEHHEDASGGLIRAILKSLDELKITEKTAKGGRKVTKIGQQALDLIATQVARNA
jgi:small subunit ribosomal protein S19e